MIPTTLKKLVAASQVVIAMSFAMPKAHAVDLKLYTIECGEVDMLDLAIFARGGEFDGRQNKASDACFLVQHPKGYLLWDTGLPKGIAAQKEGVTNGPFSLRIPVTLEAQLEQINVSASDIDYVSISHAHFDHSGNLNDYANATWLVHENEYDAMFSDAARANPQLIAGYSKMENAEKVIFKADYDVFGDGSVMILAMPGHTPGHTVLRVNLENTGPVLLSGDLYHLTESRELRTIPTFNSNVEQTLASMDRFEALAKEIGARVVIQHEKADIDAMPDLPGYLD